MINMKGVEEMNWQKKRILIFLLCGIVLCGCACLIFGEQITSPCIELESSTALKDSLQYKESRDEKRTIINLKAKAELTSIPVDVYEDESQNQYCFFKGTDIFCSYQNKDFEYGVYVENPITEQEALLLAEQYLSGMIAEFDQYTHVLTQHGECEKIYFIQFSYYLFGVLSDDLINVFMQEDGMIGCVDILNRGAFYGLSMRKKTANKIANKSKEEEGTRFYSLLGDQLVLVERKDGGGYAVQKINSQKNTSSKK